MSAEDAVLAQRAITRAEALVENASPLEAELIRAARVRCAADFDPDARRPVEVAWRRETKEEAGIDVGEVRYHASQPWPFPLKVPGEMAIAHHLIRSWALGEVDLG